MGFVEKLGRFINQQATEWKMLYKTEKEHPNNFATFAKASTCGVVHWAFISLATVCLAVEGIYYGQWTVEVASEDLFSTTWKLMAGLVVLHFLFDYFNKRLTPARCLGYLSGVLLALVVFMWKLNEISQFKSTSMIHYLSFLFAGWLWTKFVAFALGPMTITWNKKNNNKE